MHKKKVETSEDPVVWQKGIDLVRLVYLLTADGKVGRDFGLRDQFRRAAVPIPINIFASSLSPLFPSCGLVL